MTDPSIGYRECLAEVGARVAGPASDQVDAQARFPVETAAALAEAKALSALIPPEQGGLGLSLSEVASGVTALARHCASSAMVLAMHHIQVACLVRHGRGPTLEGYLRTVADRQLLLASATSEAGIGGNLRKSTCAVTPSPSGFRLEKQATVISYGQHADGILATARRSPDSPDSDQVLVVCRRESTSLEPNGTWDTLGFRGTCSLGFLLRAEDEMGYVLPPSFSDISSRTMLPVSHILWSAVWLGLALEAESRARRYVQAQARKNPGTTPPAAIRLAELEVLVSRMASTVAAASSRFEAMVPEDGEAFVRPGFVVDMNALKVGSSDLVLEVVQKAMVICGMEGYRQDSANTMGRLLRDAIGASVMINNDRINANNAQMLMAMRGER